MSILEFVLVILLTAPRLFLPQFKILAEGWPKLAAHSTDLYAQAIAAEAYR